MKRQVVAMRVCDLRDAVPQLAAEPYDIAHGIGPDGEVWFAFPLSPAEAIGAARDGAAAGSHPFRVMCFEHGLVAFDLTLMCRTSSVDDVQPFGPEALLLLGADDGDDADGEISGWIYSRDGRFERSVRLGQAVGTMQVNRRAETWVAYTDEGSDYMAAWDPSGRQVFPPAASDEDRIDAYCELNVASDTDVWVYRESAVPLLQLRDRRIVQVWAVPVAYAKALAVDGDHVLLCNGMLLTEESVAEMNTPVDMLLTPEGKPLGENEIMSRLLELLPGFAPGEAPVLFLVHLRSDQTGEVLAQLEPCDDTGAALVPEYSPVGRGAFLYLRRGTTVWRVGLEDALPRPGH